jgi:hypothetical protein
MFLHCICVLPESSPVHEQLKDFPAMWTRVLEREIQYVTMFVDMPSARQSFIARYAIEVNVRARMHRAMIGWHLAIDLGPYIKFIVTQMLYMVSEMKFDVPLELVHEWRYPVRFEAVRMIVFLIKRGEKYRKPLAEALISGNFVENERKLAETNNDYLLVQSSMTILRAVINSPVGFERLIPSGRTVLHALEQRFTRDLMDPSAFAALQIPPSPSPKKKKERPSTSMASKKAPPTARSSSSFVRRGSWK